MRGSTTRRKFPKSPVFLGKASLVGENHFSVPSRTELHVPFFAATSIDGLSTYFADKHALLDVFLEAVWCAEGGLAPGLRARQLQLFRGMHF